MTQSKIFSTVALTILLGCPKQQFGEYDKEEDYKPESTYSEFHPVFTYRTNGPVPLGDPEFSQPYRALESVPDSIQRFIFQKMKGRVVFVVGPLTDQKEFRHLKGKKNREDEAAILYDDIEGLYSPLYKAAFFRVGGHREGTATHEFGHMLDHLGGYAFFKHNMLISSTADWIYAVNDCDSELLELSRSENNYLGQQFAEGFSVYYSLNATKRKELKDQCPDVAQFFLTLEGKIEVYLRQ